MDTVLAWNSRDMVVVIQNSDHLSDHITTDGRNEANLATLNVHALENLSSVFELLVTPKAGHENTVVDIPFGHLSATTQ